MKKWCFWTVVLDKTLESSLDYKPVNPKGNQPWIFIGRTDAEADAPTLWSLDVKNWLIGKTLMLGKIEGGRRRGTTEDEMAGWHHWLNGRETKCSNSGSWWWTGRPGVLQVMGSQRVAHNWVTELNIMTKALFQPALLSWYPSVLLHRLKTSYFKKGGQCGWSNMLLFPSLHWRVSILTPMPFSPFGCESWKDSEQLVCL